MFFQIARPFGTLDGDSLACVLKDGVPHVSVRHVCEAMGLGFASQHQKLKASAWGGVTIIVTPDSSGVAQTYAMIPVKSLSMWLATIHATKVGADVLRDGVPHVSVRHVCDALEIDFSSQLKKLKTAPWGGVVMIATPDSRGLNHRRSSGAVESCGGAPELFEAGRVSTTVGLRGPLRVPLARPHAHNQSSQPPSVFGGR